MRTFDIVVAADLDGGIGKDGKLPWHLPGDMAFFKRITSEVQDQTKQNAVIMGRKTWDSIPEKFRPLKGRRNFVLTGEPARVVASGIVVAGDFDSCLSLADLPEIENMFVIGGGAVYKEALKHQACSRVFLTAVEQRFECDVFLPVLDDFVEDTAATSEPMTDNGISYRFKLYKRK